MSKYKDEQPNFAATLFGTQRCKYSVLDEKIGDKLNDLSDMVTVVISTKDLFKSLRSDFYSKLAGRLTDNIKANRFKVAAEALNLIGFYRNYFSKRNTDTRFIIVHGDAENGVNEEFEYRDVKTYDDVAISKLVEASLKIMEAMVKCIPDLHVIKSNPDNPLTANRLIVLLSKCGYLDEGSTVLMTYDKELFSTLRYIPDPYIYIPSSSRPTLYTGSEVFNIYTEVYKTKYKYIPEEMFLLFTAIDGCDSFENLPPEKFKRATLLKRLAVIYESEESEAKDAFNKYTGILTSSDSTQEELEKAVLEMAKIIYFNIDLDGQTLEGLSSVIAKRIRFLDIGKYTALSYDSENYIRARMDIAGADDEETALDMNTQHFDDLINVRFLYT